MSFYTADFAYCIFFLNPIPALRTVFWKLWLSWLDFLIKENVFSDFPVLNETSSIPIMFHKCLFYKISFNHTVILAVIFLASYYTELTFLMVEYDFPFQIFFEFQVSFNTSPWTAFWKWREVHILILVRQIAFH